MCIYIYIYIYRKRVCRISAPGLWNSAHTFRELVRFWTCGVPDNGKRIDIRCPFRSMFDRFGVRMACSIYCTWQANWYPFARSAPYVFAIGCTTGHCVCVPAMWSNMQTATHCPSCLMCVLVCCAVHKDQLGLPTITIIYKLDTQLPAIVDMCRAYYTQLSIGRASQIK